MLNDSWYFIDNSINNHSKGILCLGVSFGDIPILGRVDSDLDDILIKMSNHIDIYTNKH